MNNLFDYGNKITPLTGNQNLETNSLYNDKESGILDSEIGRTDHKLGRGDRDLGDADRVLVGIFESENEAINVIKRLKEIGYSEDEITVIAKDKDKMDRLEDETDIDTKNHGDSDEVGVGAAIGGVLGGLVAALPALGLLAIPGVGPILAAGPIVSILGGVIAGGVAGGLIGGLVELGVDKQDAEAYEKQIKQGKIVIFVKNKDDWSDDIYATYRQNNSLMGGSTGLR
ncbi:general stress protein [Fusibacter sp. 3D3]|uniref:general stress protein n=1 Tax=Fusibacter sp. 3D3 TaxID=1048380 RepID=UPI0008535D02|nr:general stress protein [Fusibacter sp. 3D3]GAU79183.1 succinyl-CoA ligase beta chain [Fusibacter sp. 3D3]